jgi:hypothetical protein
MEETVMSEKKDAYVKELKARIDKWNAEIDKLAAKAEQAEAESKIGYHKRLDDLRTKRKDMEDKMAAVHQAGEESWQGLKQGLEKSWDAFTESLTKAKSEFERGYREEKTR